MNEKNSLIVKENNLPKSIKQEIKKLSKAIGYGAFAVGSATIGLTAITTAPLIIIPSAIGVIYGTHKFANETIYKSHKDVAFHISNSLNGNKKITQDQFRLDITAKTKGMSLREIAGFTQLQALVGVSKLDRFDKKGNTITYETESHGPIRSTLKKLNQMGIIKNYSEHYKRNSRFIVEKLAMGNTDSIKNKEEMYDIKFELGDNKIEFENPEFRKNFKLIFSEKSGLLIKKNWDLVLSEDGSYSIDYNAQESFLKRINRQLDKGTGSLKDIKQEVITLEEQKQFIENLLENQKHGAEKIESKDEPYKE